MTSVTQAPTRIMGPVENDILLTTPGPGRFVIPTNISGTIKVQAVAAGGNGSNGALASSGGGAGEIGILWTYLGAAGTTVPYFIGSPGAGNNAVGASATNTWWDDENQA